MNRLVLYTPRLLRFVAPRMAAPMTSVRFNNGSTKPPEASSFVMNIFRGQMRTEDVFPYPDVLTDDERQSLSMFLGPVTKFVEEVNDSARNDREEGAPPETINHLKELGAFGLQVPTDMNGLGLTNTQYARLIEVLAGDDLGLGIFLGAHQSIGFKGILLYGTEDQKAKYLPPLAAGEKIAAYCLTEPTSGSDANSIRTRAELSEDGKHYILNGGKTWISNGGIADVFTVFAQTPVKDPRTGEVTDKVTAFIVERSFPGVTSGPPEKKMGIKASNTAEVIFDNVKVPVENLLHEEGEGFKVAMNILNNGRFGMAAALVGTMKALIKKACNQVSTRVQFGSKLEKYGVVQEKLSRMAIQLYVTESIAYMLSGNMDKGITEYQLEAAISKIYGSESAWMVADECIQLHGGMGYMTECGLERVMRDLRIFRIFEGSNDILRLFISLTGLQYAGKHLRELEKAVKSGNMGTILSQGMKRTRRMLGASPSDSVRGLVHKDLSAAADQLSMCVGDIGVSCETLLAKYRRDIIHEQFLLQRLANASIDIYGMAAVLSRASKSLSSGFPSAQHEVLLTNAFCQQAYQRTRQNLTSLTSATDLQVDSTMASIAKEITANEGVATTHPLQV